MRFRRLARPGARFVPAVGHSATAGGGRLMATARRRVLPCSPQCLPAFLSSPALFAPHLSLPGPLQHGVPQRHGAHPLPCVPPAIAGVLTSSHAPPRKLTCRFAFAAASPPVARSIAAAPPCSSRAHRSTTARSRWSAGACSCWRTLASTRSPRWGCCCLWFCIAAKQQQHATNYICRHCLFCARGPAPARQAQCKGTCDNCKATEGQSFAEEDMSEAAKKGG